MKGGFVNLDNKDKLSININPEEEIEKIVDTAAENTGYKYLNFLINASNQTNLTNTRNLSSVQANVLFVLVNPYYIDSLNLEDMNLDIRMNENNMVVINNRKFETVEIHPGIRIFGIIKNNEE